MGFFNDIYTLYTPKERRNIGIYIIGIMLYKFGLESVCNYARHMSSSFLDLTTLK
jgi:hypothetical protein